MQPRLKSLELHGYKTFANRTYFEFAGTITAIVGPNGSGKSNIADSIRWVLGEQSYGLLRARKTEDMIFSGSDSRARAGMASATITFDNSDGWLPIDFSEVAITRRAHRDGLNEYLINGQRMRLKDVSELLSESGLAERTYTVIGQGLVDAALSLKADERRRLFEEAAGIGLHRSRREEALRRLDATRRNLDRVEDILAELKPRLSSLERQARRAVEYEQVRADLQVLLREWYGFYWHEAQKELAEAQDIAHIQEKKLQEARMVQDKAEEQLSGLREQIQDLRGVLNGWHRQLSEQHARREDAIRRSAIVEERIRSSLIQQENDLRSLDQLCEETSFHQERIAAANSEVELLFIELEEARVQANSSRAALAMRQQERAQAEQLIQSARQDLAGLNSQQGKWQAQIDEARAQEDRITKAIDAAASSLSTAEKDQMEAQIRLDSAQTLAQQAEQGLKSADEALSKHRQRQQEAENQLSEVREKRAALNADQARLKAELEVLEQAEAALSGYASGTRLILQAVRQNRLSGTRGSLNTFLEVAPEFEKAISAALGDFLDAVILDSDPDEAMDFLESESGRGVLLPLKHLRLEAPKISPLKNDDRVFGEAAELVSSPAELKPVLELLLRGVIIVRDRATARRIIFAQPAGVRAVTLRGDVYHAAGPIFSSGGEAGEQQTLLSRARQQRDVKSSADRIAGKIQSIENQLAEWKQNLEDLQTDGVRLESDQEAARQELLKTGRGLDQAKAALDRTAHQADWARVQLQKLHADRQDRQAESRRLSQQLGEIEAKAAAARAELRERSLRLESLGLDDYQMEQAHWATRLAVNERALSDARSRLQERQAALERSQQTQAALQLRLSRLEDQLKGYEEERINAHQSEAEIAEQILNLNEKIDPAEAELAERELLQTESQKQAGQIRQQVSMAEHQQAQARINLARRQESLQSLQRRIDDDFGLVAYEYVAQVSGPTPLPLSGFVEQLPMVERLSQDIEENIKRQRLQLRRIGPVNPEAQAEYHEVSQRHDFLIEQVADLEKAEGDIRQVITELDGLMQSEFRKTFDAVAAEFRQIFSRLFGGGSARLLLTDPDDLSATGIEIEARLPGRRTQGLALLSGGERSLTAASLVFASASDFADPILRPGRSRCNAG